MTYHASIQNLCSFTDQQLLTLCEKYGLQARLWRQKFLGLLPEVYKRRLYRKKGCSSIFEFAKKLAGISEEQVRLVLNLERRFEDKPTLHQALIEGQVSVNKLSRIASIATQDNEADLAEQIKLLPSRALETFVRDEKILSQSAGSPTDSAEKSDDSGRSNLKLKNLHMQTKQLWEDGQEDKAGGNFETSQTSEQNSNQKLNFSNSPDRAENFQNRFNIFLELNLSSDILSKLLELKRKGIDLNQTILDLLQQRDNEIQQEKEKLAQEAENTAHGNFTARARTKISRHISQKIKKLLQKEYGTKCAVPHCMKKSEPIHHTARFALTRSHNPFFLAPLCREHHAIAHSIDAKYQKKRFAHIAQRSNFRGT